MRSWDGHGDRMTIGPFAALDHVFSIECDDAETGERLGGILAPLATTRPPSTTYAIVTSASPLFIDVFAGDERIAHVDDSSIAEEHLIWAINRGAVDSWRGPLIHGGAVESPSGIGVLVVGRSGAGKSTLVTALVRAGFGYLSDELIPIEPDGTVRGHPRAISLKQGSWAMFPDLEPVSVEVSRSDGIGQRHVDPSRVAERIVRRTRPGLVLILTGTPSDRQPLAVDAAPPSRAVYELCHHAFDVASLGQAGLESIRSVVREATIVTMRGGSPSDRQKAAESLLR